MLCPLKFSRYEFEGGTECIGAECGFYGGVCGSVDAHSKAQSKTVPNLSEQSESLSDEADTSEKLEADVFNLIAQMVNEAYSMGEHEATWTVNRASVHKCIVSWLDRQAAITERECLVQSVQGADAILIAENAELQAAYDELTAIAVQLCRACGFTMCDASGEVIS